jgi:TolA-binding protein
MRLILLALSLALLAAGCASNPPEPDPVLLKLNDLDARIQRTEANQVEAAQRMDEVQKGLRELRGRIEELEHNSEALAKQQRDLYSDLDKRKVLCRPGRDRPVPRPPRRVRRPRRSRRCTLRRSMP